MADLVIRNATIVDGTRAPSRRGDVAITGERITEVAERVDTKGHHEVDADGLLLTPGFVDIHTHYDGQVTWDPVVAPSSLHGVTSIVMGNCGVSFAPARPTDADHDWLIGLLEGVEDIPGSALAEGLPWDWETLPDYLDALGRREWTLDIGAQVAHAPLRAFVMGERGADPNEAPTADELTEMHRLTRQGIDAGALGFTTSRTYLHRTRDGNPLGTRFSTADELTALASALTDAGRGVIQMISDAYQSADEGFVDEELALMRSLVQATGRRLSMTVQQPEPQPERWRKMIAWVGGCVADGLPMRAQVAPRPIGVLCGLEASINPFMTCPSAAEVAGLAQPERVRALADDDRRRRILKEHEVVPEGIVGEFTHGFHKLFPLTDPVDYEPPLERSVQGLAAASGRPPADVAYDLLLERDGQQLLYMPLMNYAAGDLSDVREMLLSPHSIIGLSDGGAHCGTVCDASFPTTAVALWGRDRTRGERLPIELVVHHLTQRTASHVGWHDRGVIGAGYLADINLIDLDELGAHPPTLVRDLPAGGRRLMQTAAGYRATIKRGVVTFAEGHPTGDRPGRLVRGPQTVAQ
ncbi:MAG TPA: amidohydrolase family protein [Acidimicrobiales bacterium]|nr:amidohydrolase family protein [Acidimicrobiales bacterium]